jgi:uncharacterized membrane protein
MTSGGYSGSGFPGSPVLGVSGMAKGGSTVCIIMMLAIILFVAVGFGVVLPIKRANEGKKMEIYEIVLVVIANCVLLVMLLCGLGACVYITYSCCCCCSEDNIWYLLGYESV